MKYYLNLFIRIVFVLTATSVSLQAFDLDGLKSAAGIKTEDSAGTAGFSMEAVQQQLKTVFASASPEVRGALDDVVSNYLKKNDSAIFPALQKIRTAKLTPAQSAVWTPVKNDLLGAVFERNFSFAESRASGPYESAKKALLSADYQGVTSSFSQLREGLSLSATQKDLLDSMESAVKPLQAAGSGWLKSLSGENE